MSLKSNSKTVSSAGTAEALVSSSTVVSSFTIRAMEDNAGNIFLGDSTVSSSTGAIEPRGSINWSGDVNRGTVDLADIYVDAATSSDGVDFWYILATG